MREVWAEKPGSSSVRAPALRGPELKKCVGTSDPEALGDLEGIVREGIHIGVQAYKRYRGVEAVH